MRNNQILFSVIVCTFQRLELLKKCLASLVKQKVSFDKYEIIVVDNQKKSQTNLLVDELLNKNKRLKIKLISEAKVGLGYARNKGVKEAIGKFCAFIDDDAQATEDWLKIAFDFYKTSQNDLIGFGGPIYPYYLPQKPVWFKDSYETRTWGVTERYLDRNESLSGSNMFIKREIIVKHGGFDEEIGMKGENLSVGEETSLFEKINTDKVFYYLPNLVVYHLVSTNKMQVSYQLKRSFASGVAKATRNRYISFYLLAEIVKCILAMIFFSLSGLLNIVNHKYWQNWAVENFAAVFFCFGFLIKALGININIKK